MQAAGKFGRDRKSRLSEQPYCRDSGLLVLSMSVRELLVVLTWPLDLDGDFPVVVLGKDVGEPGCAIWGDSRHFCLGCPPCIARGFEGRGLEEAMCFGLLLPGAGIPAVMGEVAGPLP